MTVTRSYRNDLVIRALRGERTSRTPVWLMRQAGRTDPAYLKLRDGTGLALEDLFRHPEWAAKISVLPQRLGIDAIIFYQDILTPLSPMGAHFVFRPGPTLVAPLGDVAAVDALSLYDVEGEMSFVGETFSGIHALLDGEMPVLGFAGSPLTLAVFILQGGSFGETAAGALSFIREHGAAAHRLLEKLTEMTIAYLKYQAGVGAAAVQLFESAAYLLSRAEYEEFALPYQQRIFSALEGVVPTIQFAREWPHLDLLDAAGADVISLPASISIGEARAVLGEDRVFQGNVDNKLLVSGTREEIAAAARACVASGESRGHIFNLSHGLLRETPYDNIVHLVETVRSVANEEEVV